MSLVVSRTPSTTHTKTTINIRQLPQVQVKTTRSGTLKHCTFRNLGTCKVSTAVFNIGDTPAADWAKSQCCLMRAQLCAFVAVPRLGGLESTMVEDHAPRSCEPFVSLFRLLVSFEHFSDSPWLQRQNTRAQRTQKKVDLLVRHVVQGQADFMMRG